MTVWVSSAVGAEGRGSEESEMLLKKTLPLRVPVEMRTETRRGARPLCKLKRHLA